MAERNLRRNFAGDGRAEVRRLEWGDAVGMVALAPPFDLILAGDAVYVSDNVAALVETISTATEPATTVLVAAPDHGATILDSSFDFYDRCGRCCSSSGRR